MRFSITGAIFAIRINFITADAVKDNIQGFFIAGRTPFRHRKGVRG